MASVGVWVGIDGHYSNAVEQIGTSSEYNPYTGEVSYSVWCEAYPKFSHQIKSMTAKAGDHIAAHVKFIPEGDSKVLSDRGHFVLSLNDKTTGESFTVVQGPLKPGFCRRS